MLRSRLSLLFAGALATGPLCSAEAELPSISIVSIEVRPMSAVSAPGKTLIFTIHAEGVRGVGTQTALSVAGAPDGTGMEASALTEQDTLLALVIPSTAAKGRYTLSVGLGSPTPVVEEEITIEIGD